VAQVARDAGLSRESVYKALSGGRSPSFATILKVVKELPKSSPNSMERENGRWGALGGHQFFGASLKILGLTVQIRRK